MADDLEQRIRERAYEIWENEGCPEGRGDEHWQQACAEYRDAKAEAGAEQAANLSGAAGPIGGTPSPGAQDALSCRARPRCEPGRGAGHYGRLSRQLTLRPGSGQAC